MNSYYNIFVGAENGLLKGINSQTKSFNNLNNSSIDTLTKDSNEILAMCWLDDETQSHIIYGTRNQHLIKYNCDLNASSAVASKSFEDLGEFRIANSEISSNSTNLLKSLESVYDEKILSCCENGVIKLWSLKNESLSTKTPLYEINAGANLTCLRKSKFNQTNEASGSTFLFATGGKENDLKVWDLNNEEETTPIFRAKNMPDNWMQLREPVWIMSMDFMDEKRVVVGTAHHQLKMYDIKSGVRKPVLNMSYGENPITSLVCLPDGSNRLIAGNSFGDMDLIDFRMPTKSTDQKSLVNNCKCIKRYKSFQGTIKSMQIVRAQAAAPQPAWYKPKKNQTLAANIGGLCVATCGLDRHMRVHHIESGQCIAKVYLKSRLNCLLYSKHEPIKQIVNKRGGDQNEEEVDDDQLSLINSEDLGTDDLWSDMETIVEEHPNLLKKTIVEKAKRKLNERLAEVTDVDNLNEDDNEDPDFKKPKPMSKKATKKIDKNLK